MKSLEFDPLWAHFNMAENNPDPGGGILYAIRYDGATLLAHQNGVTSSLVDAGARIVELEDQLAVDLIDVTLEDHDRVVTLLEELTVVNEAIEYHGAGVDADSIIELSDTLKKFFVMALTRDQLGAFDIANIFIPQIVRDIQTAHDQNGVLNEKDRAVIEDLGSFATRRARQIANNEITVIKLIP